MADTLTRVMSKVDTSGECWEWLAARGSNGYGLIRMGDRRQCAHRVVYELLVGPIPDGLEIDHLCRNRGCVNPDHLEPVTHAENVRRGEYNRAPWTAAGVAAAAAAKLARTTCVNGHPWTEESTYVRQRDGVRICRPCAADDQRRYRWRKKAA